MGTKPAKVGRLAATLLKSGDPLRLYTPSPPPPPSDPPARSAHRLRFSTQISSPFDSQVTTHVPTKYSTSETPEAANSTLNTPPPRTPTHPSQSAKVSKTDARSFKTRRRWFATLCDAVSLPRVPDVVDVPSVGGKVGRVHAVPLQRWPGNDH